MEPTLRNWVRRLGTLRFLNVLLGVWLVLSAFILPHTFDEAMVAWILGALIALSSATSFVAHEISYIDAIFAVLLGASALVLSKAPAVTRINEGGIALAVLVLSILLSRRGNARFLHFHAGH